MPVHSNYPDWLAPLLSGLAGSAGDTFTQSIAGGYKPFSGVGTRHAPTNRPEERIQEIAHQMHTYAPHIGAAQQMIGQGTQTFPAQHENYMNPYQQQVADRMSQLGNRNFTENILPALEAKFVRLGQHGGSRHAQLAQHAARDTQNEISALQGQMMHQGYGQASETHNRDMQRMMQAAQLQPALANTIFAGRAGDMAANLQAGEMTREREEAPMREAEMEHRERQAYPWHNIQQYAAALHGIPVAPPTHTPMSAPSSMHGRDWLSAAMKAATMAMGAGGGREGGPAPVERRRAGGSIRQFSPGRR